MGSILTVTVVLQAFYIMEVGHVYWNFNINLYVIKKY